MEEQLYSRGEKNTLRKFLYVNFNHGNLNNQNEGINR